MAPSSNTPGYEQYEPALPPGWLQQPYGNAWFAALGAEKDELLSKIKQGILARYALTAPLDALPSISADRGLQQGPSEPLAVYQQRLLNAWGAHQIAGTAYGILAQLNAAGYATAYIIQSNGYIYGPSGGSVTHSGTSSGSVFVGGITSSSLQVTVKITAQSTFVSNGQFQYSIDGGATYNGTSLNIPLLPGTVQIESTTSTGAPYNLLFNFYGKNNISTAGSVFELNDVFTVAANTPLPPDPVNGIAGQLPAFAQLSPYYWGSSISDLVHQQFTISSNNGQGSAGYPSTPAVPYPAGWNVQPGTNPYEFWNRFLVVFDPVPTRWNNVVNPPTGSSSPSSGEISAISETISEFGAGHAFCGGIVACTSRTAVSAVEDNRATWGWPEPMLTSDVGSFFSWYSRLDSSFQGFVQPSYPFSPLPQNIFVWSPALTVTGHDSGFYSFVVPTRANPNTTSPTNAPQAWFYTHVTGGTTGYTEPTWPTGPGTVVDGTVTWHYGGSTSEWGESSPTSTVFELE